MGWRAYSSAPECARGEGGYMETYFEALSVGTSKKTQSAADPVALNRSGSIRLWAFTLVALSITLAQAPAAAAEVTFTATFMAR